MKRFAIALLAGVAGLAIASAAQAADLIIDEPAAGVVEVAGGNWDGAFIGGFVGGIGGDLVVDGDDVADLSGWTVGVVAGVNFTLTEGIVAGVVGDLAWADVEDEFEDTAIDWTASLRGRLGFDAGAFMPYLTAGVAAAHAELLGGGDDVVHWGWTVGAGVEFAVTDDLSLDLLYRYTDYSDEIYTPGPSDEIGYTTHAITVGVNFKF